MNSMIMALVGSWTGIIFSFNPLAVEHAIDNLAAKRDSAYFAAAKIDPKITQSLKASFQKEFDLAANGFLRPSLFLDESYVFEVGKQPPGLPDPRTSQDPDGYYWVSRTEQIFWNVYDLSHVSPLFAAALGYLIPDTLKDENRRQGHFTYAYCEQDPTNDYCQKRARQVSVGDALARRVVSSPVFVREVCSSFTTVLKKHVDWTNEYLAGKQIAKVVNLNAHFDLIDSTLGYLEAGAWNANKFDERMGRWQRFLFRRYLDGGPQLMTASRECLQKVRVALQSPSEPSTTLPDPATTGYLQEMMAFEAKPYPANPRRFLDLQTKALDKEAVARIFRQIPPNVALPKIYEYEGSSQEAILELSQMMSRLDPKYDYRVLIADEFNAFVKEKTACVANKDYLNFGYEDLRLEARGEDDDGCRWNHLIFVRIPKITSTNGFVSAGTCYADFNCSAATMRDVSADQCRHSGGHSWASNSRGRCERL